MRQIQSYETEAGEKRYKVRYRLGKQETSETFRRLADAEMFRDLLGNGRDGRTEEALRWLQGKQAERDASTFAQWFDQWVDQLTGVTPRTRADYHSMSRRYLGELHPLPLPLITRGHVTSLVNRLDDAGLSAKTIENVIHMLSSCLGLARDEGHIVRNPVYRIRLPATKLDVVEARFLTHEEFNRLHRVIREDYQPLVAFLVGTGLRWSEATALQWRHIDFDRATVRVERAWKWEGKGKGYRIGVPKSPKSRRTVNAAVDALLPIADKVGRSDALVFQTVTGKPVRHNNFYGRIWQPGCEAAKFDPAPRIHDLRHTHASWLISDGIPLEAVQDQLGHESILTTRKVYGHLLPAVGVAVGKAASVALARALDGSQGAHAVLEPRRDPDQ